MLRIGIVGFTGRMGKSIASLLNENENISEIVPLMKQSSPSQEDFTGNMVNGDTEYVTKNGKIIRCTTSVEELFMTTNAVIDFSSPQGFEECLHFCLQSKERNVLISGTTGVDSRLIERLESMEFRENGPVIFWAPNTSIGINIVYSMIHHTKKSIMKNYDWNIEDIHHKHKKDSPSGTAILLSNALGIDISEAIQQNKFNSIRSGEVIGEHTLNLESDLENISITHKANDRKLFSYGAIEAAMWSLDQRAGFYTMRDMIEQL